jgi:hypothetical protein
MPELFYPASTLFFLDCRLLRSVILLLRGLSEDGYPMKTVCNTGYLPLKEF